jgi:hypothetical protein
MSRLRLAPIGLLSTLLLTACVGTGSSPGASAPPTPSQTPTGTPTPAIDHPTGATAVILRMSTGGGFLAPGALLTEIPEFSLYGDGTVIFRDPAKSYVEPARPDGIGLRLPFQTAHLSEPQVQAILADAIGPGGLGTAREDYPPCCVADAPSTTFTLNAGGLEKVVTVGALGFDEPQSSPDDTARAAFAALAQGLVAPDLGGVTVTNFLPSAYRGILAEGQPDPSATVAPRPWPWTSFGPADFRPSGPDGLAVPTRSLTTADVAALKLEGVEGGASSIALRTANGKVYLLALRPLLPDEPS